MTTTQRKAQIGSWGVDLEGFDRSVRPQDDFDEFVNGAWKKKTQIPRKEFRWGVFSVLRESSQKAIREILEEIAAQHAPWGSNVQKIRDFYKSGMNARRLNREGTQPLAEEFTLIDFVKTREDLVKVIAHLHLRGISVFWSTEASPDFKDTNVMVLTIRQNGLSLPGRGYYFDKDKDEIRKKFVLHVRRIFKLLGYDMRATAVAAETVMRIETKLAQKSWTAVQLRDIKPQINYRTVKDLVELAPSVDWDLYFEELGVPSFEQLMVFQLEFMKQVDSVIRGFNLDDLKIYLKWWLIMRTANFLSDDFVNEDFDFWGRTLVGSEVLKPRWQRCATFLNAILGEVLGQEYVKRHFPPEAKVKINELVDNVLVVMGGRIRNLDWMTPATKQRALEKLDAFTRKLGYPDKWKDYGALEIKRDSYVLNYLRAVQFHVRSNLSKVGQPTDKEKWQMTPSTVNAYFNAQQTEIVFPAGILQPPFFDPNADDAVNYGAIGLVIGHEITHGFDDKGSKFDKDGNFKNWWSKKDREEFETRCKAIVEQFDAYEALPGVFINGTLTQGENIADLGGLSMAYEAYMRSLEDKDNPPVLDGFTHQQRFFLGYAQVWRSKYRMEALRKKVATDTHPPDRFRILGILINTDAFFEAFDVQEGDKMWRSEDERVKIW